MQIDPTARIAQGAIIGEGVEIGPYVIVGEKVRIGAYTKIGAFVVVEGQVEVGAHCFIGCHSVIGTPPQDVSYRGEETKVVIGDRTILREFVTIHRATGEGKMTHLGEDCFIMAYCHIAHNCFLGNGVTMANAAMLAGYVVVDDWATLGGLAGVHQFVHVGKLCMVGGMSKVVMDVPPYTLVDGHPARIFGLNRIGMKRRGIPEEKRETVKKIYTMLYRSGIPIHKALEELKKSSYDPALVEEIITFFTQSKRGIVRWVSGEVNNVEEDAPFSW